MMLNISLISQEDCHSCFLFLFHLQLKLASSWPQIHNSSASASRVLQLPVCATTPGIKINTYEMILRIDSYINHNDLIPISYICTNLLTFWETLQRTPRRTKYTCFGTFKSHSERYCQGKRMRNHLRELQYSLFPNEAIL